MFSFCGKTELLFVQDSFAPQWMCSAPLQSGLKDGRMFACGKGQPRGRVISHGRLLTRSAPGGRQYGASRLTWWKPDKVWSWKVKRWWDEGTETQRYTVRRLRVMHMSDWQCDKLSVTEVCLQIHYVAVRVKVNRREDGRFILVIKYILEFTSLLMFCCLYTH